MLCIYTGISLVIPKAISSSTFVSLFIVAGCQLAISHARVLEQTSIHILVCLRSNFTLGLDTQEERYLRVAEERFLEV